MKVATYQDVLDAPEHMVAEILNGELILNPRPAFPHAVAASAIGGELWAPFRKGMGGPGGWMLLVEPELHFDKDILVPDIGGWRQDRLPPSAQTGAFTTIAPDWVCEVLSPRTTKMDRSRKLPIYARAQVQFAWLVDPLERMVEVLRRDGKLWTTLSTFSDDAKIRAEPFEAFELDLTILWGLREDID